VAAYYVGVLVCLVEGTVLLGFLTVAGEGLGERVCWGSGVRMGCVVDLCASISMRTLGALGECDANVLEGVTRLPKKRIMGWRPWRRNLVAFIVVVWWCGVCEVGAEVREQAFRLL
jgi:hypothetical protein